MGLKAITKMSAPHLSPARKKLAELFGVDLRSLAAFRIGVGLVLLADLLFRAEALTAYFTDAGILPRTARIELFELGDRFGFRHMWSLHMLSGTLWSQVVMFVIAAVFAFWLMVGYRTRLAAVASWILLLSLDARNPVILNSGDVLLRSMLLWSLFLPLGACWSIDRRLAGKDSRLPTRVLSMASIALLLQLGLMYWFSAVFKAKPVEGMASPWTEDFSAVYYALNCDAFATRIGLWLRQFPTVMQGLTVFSLAIEVVGPILVFSPWLTKWLRGGVVAAFCLFHLALWATLTLGLFPVICIVCWLLFVPGEFWEALAGSRLIQRAMRGLRAKTDTRMEAARRWFRHPAPLSFRRHGLVEAGLCCLFLYLLAWNIRETDFKYWEPRILPRTWNGPARVLGLDQNWSMFAPLPRTEDGWLVMKGTLHDGSEVNLWDFDKPLPWAKPRLVSATYKTQRWRKYLDNLTTDDYAAHRMYLCDWLARRWDQHLAEGQDEQKVHKVELIQRLEITPPPGKDIGEPESKVLWTWYYE